MINTIQSENKNMFPSPLLRKLEDPGVPSIHYSINQWNFQRVVCDTGLGINLMSKVTYELIYGDLPLYSTYITLQMADQSQRFPEGIVGDVPVKIKDNYVLTDFLVIYMGDEQDPPIVLGRPFLNTTRAIIYIRTGEINFQFRTEKVRCYFNTYTNPEQPKKNKTQKRLQRLQRKLNTKLTDVKNIEEEIKEKSAQLLPAQHSEPITLERSPPKKQVWRKKDQSTPWGQSLPASLTNQSMANTSTPWE
jgi:hypothetical protein